MNVPTCFLPLLILGISAQAEEVRDDPAKGLGVREYGQYEEATEYGGAKGMSAMLSRAHWVNKTGRTEALVKNPEGLDQRREAILDALWFGDESSFELLAASPITAEGGLANQDFDKISREFRKYDRYGIRTMRSHPIVPVSQKEHTSTWCRHQWMTLPASKSSTPRRGNINLIFDAKDLSLRFVRISFFPTTRDQFPLPFPDSNIPDDPVVDRGPSDERVLEALREEERERKEKRARD